MPKTIGGSCNHCGKCCLRSGGVMMENPMIELHEDRCKFYVDKLNKQKYGHCLIFAALSKGTLIEKIKDRNERFITKEQIQWFNDNCPGYPKPEDIEKGLTLPKDCKFYISEG